MKNFSSARVLILTFEFGDSISGGIGSCLNGLVPELEKKIPVTVALVHWNFSRHHFSCKEYSGAKKIKNHQVPAEETLLGIVRKKAITLIHLHHAAPELLGFVKVIKHHCPWIRFVYSCHSLNKHERQLRPIMDSAIICEQKILNEADVIHVLSPVSKARVLTQYPEICAEKIVIIPNAIGMNDFRPAWSEKLLGALVDAYFWLIKRLTGKRWVLCASRWTPAKGLEFFLEAIPHIHQKVPNCRFIVVGKKINTWDDQSVLDYKATISEKIMQLKKIPIKTYGWINRRMMSSLIKAADCCVVPSKTESFPYSFLEPAFLGAPIACSRLEPIEEIAVNGKEFLGFEAGNSSELAKQVIRLLNDKKLSAELARKANELMERKYTWPLIATYYCNAYTALINLAEAKASCANGSNTVSNLIAHKRDKGAREIA